MINKIDRPGARPDWVINQTFDLFDKLGATEEQMDFPVVYASALNGYATLDLDNAQHGHAPVVRNRAQVCAGTRSAMSMRRCNCRFPRWTTPASYGRIGVGRVRRGRVKPGQDVMVMSHGDKSAQARRINQVLGFRGLERVPVG